MDNEVRPIDANRLLTAMVAHRAYYCDDTYDDGIAFNIITDMIQTIKEDIPTLDYKPVRYAHWEKSKNFYGNVICSNCQDKKSEHWHIEKEWDYCNCCGCKMIGGDENDT